MIVLVFIDAIGYDYCIDCINFIDPGVINCRALQLKDNTNEPKNSWITIWGKNGNFLRLLACPAICKDFTRFDRKINKISLGFMNSDSPQDKFLPFETVEVLISYPCKKGITIVICNLSFTSIHGKGPK